MSWIKALLIVGVLLLFLWVVFGRTMGRAELDLNTQERNSIFKHMAPEITVEPEFTQRPPTVPASHSTTVPASEPTAVTLTNIVLENPLPRPKEWSNSRPSQGEARCKAVLEKIFGRPFVTVRPDFLKNPATKRNLELDAYNHDLRLAVEYQGSHHYPPRHPTVESVQKFEYRQQLDALKAQLCEQHNIRLITVPCTIKLEDIEAYIIERLPEEFRNLLPSQ